MKSFRHALATIALGATAATVLTACHPSLGATGALQAALAATATADPGSTTTTTTHAAATTSAAATTTADTTTAVTTTATADTTTTVTAPTSSTAMPSGAASTTDPSASVARPTPTPQPTRTATTPPTATAPTTTAPTATAPTTTVPTTTPTTPPRTTTAPPPADTSIAGQILALVDDERAKAGCRAVTLDSRLTQAAAGHSQDMAANNYFSHTSQDGRSFVDRIRATGYTAARSENIAAGQPSPAAVMTAWMNSPGHRANILDPTATQMGVASATGGSYGIYWTQDFGTA